MNSLNASFIGKVYDWGSISMEVLGDYQIGVDSIDIKHTQDSLNIYGAGQLPIGYYNKNEEFSASIGFLYDQFSSIIAAALAEGLTPMQIPPFSINMTLGSTADPLVPYQQYTLLCCRFKSSNFTAKQNTGAWYQVYDIAFAGLTIVI